MLGFEIKRIIRKRCFGITMMILSLIILYRIVGLRPLVNNYEEFFYELKMLLSYSFLFLGFLILFFQSREVFANEIIAHHRLYYKSVIQLVLTPIIAATVVSIGVIMVFSIAIYGVLLTCSFNWNWWFIIFRLIVINTLYLYVMFESAWMIMYLFGFSELGLIYFILSFTGMAYAIGLELGLIIYPGPSILNALSFFRVWDMTIFENGNFLNFVFHYVIFSHIYFILSIVIVRKREWWA